MTLCALHRYYLLQLYFTVLVQRFYTKYVLNQILSICFTRSMFLPTVLNKETFRQRLQDLLKVQSQITSSKKLLLKVCRIASTWGQGPVLLFGSFKSPVTLRKSLISESVSSFVLCEDQNGPSLRTPSLLVLMMQLFTSVLIPLQRHCCL